jgi:phosphohistidine phosphatase
MALYLVQHGKSLPRESDSDPGLSEQGMADVQRIAEVARGYGVRVAKVLHSGKKRAAQTANLMGASLQPAAGIDAVGGLQPLDAVAPWADAVHPEEDLMLVGHLPFMERLTSLLVVGNEQPVIFKFQNGGIVCLDRPAESASWYIKWTLMPCIS